MELFLVGHIHVSSATKLDLSAESCGGHCICISTGVIDTDLEVTLLEGKCGKCPLGSVPATNNKLQIEAELQACCATNTLDNCLCIKYDTTINGGTATSGIIYRLVDFANTPDTSCNNSSPVTNGYAIVTNEKEVYKEISDWCSSSSSSSCSSSDCCYGYYKHCCAETGGRTMK